MIMQGVAVHFPDRLRLRGPHGLRTAIEMAAAAQNTTPSEWSRRALLQGLQADGLHLRNGQIAVVRTHDDDGTDGKTTGIPKTSQI